MIAFEILALAALAGAPQAEVEPRGVRLGLGLGAYTPNADAGLPGGATPYGDLFEGGSLMLRPEIAWVTDQVFGELSLSLSVGYFKDTAKAFKEGTTVRSGGETSLRLIPVTGLVGLRTRWLEPRLRFPLHPYLKLGGSYTFWRITDGQGRTAEVGDAVGSGGSLGLVGVVGVAVALEGFEEQGRRALREDYGVHGADLFFEWRYDRTLEILGAAPFRVGDSTWQAGLQFLF